MSYGFSLTVRKAKAVEAVAGLPEYVPASVKALLKANIETLRCADDAIIDIQANGHVGTASQDYDNYSNHDIKLRVLKVAE